jgi:hypothetical protein
MPPTCGVICQSSACQPQFKHASWGICPYVVDGSAMLLSKMSTPTPEAHKRSLRLFMGIETGQDSSRPSHFLHDGTTAVISSAKRIGYRRRCRACNQQLCDLAIVRLTRVAIEMQFNSVRVVIIIGLALLRVPRGLIARDNVVTYANNAFAILRPPPTSR